MTDKIYLGILIIMIIIVLLGDISLVEYMGKIKKYARKGIKCVIVNRSGTPHKIPIDFEIDPTGDYDVVSKALDISSKKAKKTDRTIKK